MIHKGINKDLILSELKKIKIIDAHEHLPAETIRLQKKVDSLTLFSHYCRRDLVVSGWFTMEQAVDIAKMLLYDNPRELYQL